MNSTGVKDDADKLRYCLSDPRADRELAAVLTYGAAKYTPNGWRSVEAWRYVESARRHFEAYRGGQVYDPENRLHHLGEAIASLHFLLAMELEKEDNLAFPIRLAAAMEQAREVKAARQHRELRYCLACGVKYSPHVDPARCGPWRTYHAWTLTEAVALAAASPPPAPAPPAASGG